MIELKGYEIKEKIYGGQKTIVFRAVRKKDNLPVILKLLKEEYPDLKDIAKIEHEYEITRNLNVVSKVKAGSFEAIFIKGYPGIGKTALVNELLEYAYKDRGRIAVGKFDQYKKNIPYSAFIQALKGLIKRILVENDQEILLCKKRMLEKLAGNGQIVIDVIPEVEKIIGSQPPVPKLPPVENQNRIKTVFLEFVQLLATEERPLLLFLDDLQWADLSSLKLLESSFMRIVSSNSFKFQR